MSDYEVRAIIRNRLIECRLEANLTQKEVGDIVGKKPTTVASWEQGMSLPDIETLYNLTKYYGKSLKYMFGEE
ncbi:MAG: helix-turn-helix transcriptional regulator [Bacteroidales bacterium]|nr:helix-turn-helix transcriptional regulator [Bacteroidales bacterium]